MPEHAAGLRRWTVLALGLVALLGLLQVPTPLTGDQALYVVGARSLVEGRGLTDGFWVDKTPAVFLWYAGVRALAGEGAGWFRAAEVVWCLGFATWLSVRFGSRFGTAGGRFALPLLVVGAHLAIAGAYELGQVEALIGLPLFVAVWGVLPEADGTCPPVRRRVLAGVGAGLALLFKQPYLAIPAATWAVLVVRTPAARRLRWLFPAIVAAGVTLLLAAAWIAATGDLGDALWTWFRYAPSSGNLDGHPLGRLRSMVETGAVLYGVAAAVALVGVLRRRREADPLRDALVTWVLVGGVLLLPQHWWDYLPTLLVVPVGFLAADGIEALARSGWFDARRWAVPVLALALAAPAAAATSGRLVDLGRHGFAIGAADRAAYRASIEAPTADALAFRAALGPDGPEEGVYVLADPQFQYEAGVPYAAAVNGWSPELMTEELWDRLIVELEVADPGHVVVDEFALSQAEARGPGFVAWLTDGYCQVRRFGQATWYARNGSAECAEG